MNRDPLGAILAGGASNRMGRDKALVELAGKPMFRHVADALRPLIPEIIVVGRDGRLDELRCVGDDRPARRGPLAGLATALAASQGRPVLLVAVDQPLVRTETLRRLIALADGEAVVPIDGDSRQVTCAIYPAEWAAGARREDEAGGSIQSLLDRLPHRRVEAEEWSAWGEDGRSWRSLDTPDAVAAAAALLGP